MVDFFSVSDVVHEIKPVSAKAGPLAYVSCKNFLRFIMTPRFFNVMSVSFSTNAREASGENADLQQICQVKKIRGMNLGVGKSGEI